MGHSRRARALAVIVLGSVFAIGVAAPVSARATHQDELSADLDGKPIPLDQVGNWYCHDFDYPVIHCFTDPAQLQDSSLSAQASRKVRALSQGDLAAATSGVTYVTIYEFTSYQGAFMQMSENYSLLSLIGWNDRISSFKVRNGLSGAFWTDWLYSGTKYNFCCAQEVGFLGSFDDTFSSVFHN